MCITLTDAYELLSFNGCTAQYEFSWPVARRISSLVQELLKHLKPMSIKKCFKTYKDLISSEHNIYFTKQTPFTVEPVEIFKRMSLPAYGSYCITRFASCLKNLVGKTISLPRQLSFVMFHYIQLLDRNIVRPKKL